MVLIWLCFYPEYETSPLFNGGIPSILVQWYPTVSLDESSQDRTIYNIMLCERTFARFVVTLLWNWSLRSTETPSWGEIKINWLYDFILLAVLRRFERALFLHGPDLSENTWVFDSDELQLVPGTCWYELVVIRTSRSPFLCETGEDLLAYYESLPLGRRLLDWYGF